MTPDRLFSLVNPLALLGWAALILVPRRAARLVPVTLAVALSLLYVVLIAVALPGSDGNFSSLAGVRTLFEDPWALLAGWVHYLAFDLFIGGWEVRDAQRRGIPHLAVIPALILTFLFGPAGLLTYLAIRTALRGRTTPMADALE
ncbi:MAG: DUF4281 domain-containing protein [Gemmatimonadaceae bacterium]|nr:DUF4281 domain-containing protein [Gemmatimonadaceae bacterium]